MIATASHSAAGHHATRPLLGTLPDFRSERSERRAHQVAKPREATGSGRKAAPVSLLETETASNTLHPPGPACFTDSVAEHRFRCRVADDVERQGWIERANALRMCGAAAIHVQCGCCEAPHLIPFRCGARTCPTCARNAATAIVERMAAKVKLHDEAMKAVAWDGAAEWDRLTYYRRATSPRAPLVWRDRRWRVVTITRRPYDAEDPFQATLLRSQVREARRLFSAWWRLTPWGRQKRDLGSRKKRSRLDTSFIVGLEIAPGGMVHFHAAIYGEYVQQSALLAAWRSVLQKAGIAASDKDGGVRVEKVRTVEGVQDALKEVLKYATKGQTKNGVEQMPSAYRAAVVECAFRNVRRSDVGGALRSITNDDICDEQKDDLHNQKVASCQACGVVGEWKWFGVRSRKYVDNNGGFGLWRVDAFGEDIAHVYRGPPDRGHN